MNPAIAAIVIICGPGLTGCSNTTAAIPAPQPYLIITSPGTIALTGTRLTIDYAVATDNYETVWHDGEVPEPKWVNSTLADAVTSAQERVDRMREMGIVP